MGWRVWLGLRSLLLFRVAGQRAGGEGHRVFGLLGWMLVWLGRMCFLLSGITCTLFCFMIAKQSHQPAPLIGPGSKRLIVHVHFQQFSLLLYLAFWRTVQQRLLLLSIRRTCGRSSVLLSVPATQLAWPTRGRHLPTSQQSLVVCVHHP